MIKFADILVYDVEIVKAIPDRYRPPEPGIEYCRGWDDKGNMGVSVVGAYDAVTDRYRVFTAEGLEEFAVLASRRTVVGFNSLRFDDELLCLNGVRVRTDWDLLQEMWAADGLGPDYASYTHRGYGLDVLAVANGFEGKTGHGSTAPVEWQRGHYGRVIDYCLNDVRLTWKLTQRVIEQGHLWHPKRPATRIWPTGRDRLLK